MTIAGLISGFVSFLLGLFLTIHLFANYTGMPNSFLGVVFTIVPFFVAGIFVLFGGLMIFGSIIAMWSVE